MGKNDGSVQNIRYFQTNSQRGLFVRRKTLEPINPVDYHPSSLTNTPLPRYYAEALRNRNTPRQNRTSARRPKNTDTPRITINSIGCSPRSVEVKTNSSIGQTPFEADGEGRLLGAVLGYMEEKVPVRDTSNEALSSSSETETVTNDDDNPQGDDMATPSLQQRVQKLHQQQLHRSSKHPNEPKSVPLIKTPSASLPSCSSPSEPHGTPPRQGKDQGERSSNSEENLLNVSFSENDDSIQTLAAKEVHCEAHSPEYFLDKSSKIVMANFSVAVESDESFGTPTSTLRGEHCANSAGNTALLNDTFSPTTIEDGLEEEVVLQDVSPAALKRLLGQAYADGELE